MKILKKKKKMNSLMKGEGVALFKIWRMSWVPVLNFERHPGSRDPTSQGPGPTFTPYQSDSVQSAF